MSNNPQPDLPPAPGAQAGSSSAQVDTSAPFSGLVAANPQPELFEADEYGGGRELLLPEDVQVRRFTTERVQQNRARFDAILRALGQGMPQSAIARAFEVSRNTLAAIVARHHDRVEQERKRTAALAAFAGRGCVEEIIDRMGHGTIPARDLAIIAGILIDKSLLLDGRPTAITETKRGPTADEINAYIESLPVAGTAAASSGSSDAQSDEIGQVPLRLTGPQAAGLQSGARPAVQKAPIVPDAEDQAGASSAPGAPDPAAEQGGGGGRATREGGAISMDPLE